MKAKTYDTRKAMIAVGIAMLDGREPDARAILAENTDIPEDRLDVAAHEMRQTFFGFRQLINFFKVIADDRAQSVRYIEETVNEAKWTDDDKRDLTISAKMDDEAEPFVTVATKLKPMGEADV